MKNWQFKKFEKSLKKFLTNEMRCAKLHQASAMSDKNLKKDQKS